MSQAHCFNFPFTDFKPDLQKCLRVTGLFQHSSKDKCFVLQNLPWSQAWGWLFLLPSQNSLQMDYFLCAKQIQVKLRQSLQSLVLLLQHPLGSLSLLLVRQGCSMPGEVCWEPRLSKNKTKGGVSPSAVGPASPAKELSGICPCERGMPPPGAHTLVWLGRGRRWAGGCWPQLSRGLGLRGSPKSCLRSRGAQRLPGNQLSCPQTRGLHAREGAQLLVL